MPHFHPEVDAFDEEVPTPSQKKTQDAVSSFFLWIFGAVIFSAGAIMFVAILHLPMVLALAMLVMAIGLAGMIKS